MKKYFTLSLILLVFTFGLRAQTVTIDPASFEIHISATDQDATHSTVYNNSAISRTLRWIRVAEATNPSQWTSTVCDLNNCYSATTSSMQFVLGPNSNGLLDVTVNPNDYGGQGGYTILVYDINDSINTNAFVNIDVVAEGTTGISDPVEGGITIFPIPAKDVLNVNFQGVKNVSSVEVYNVVGQKMKSVNVIAGSKGATVPVSDLKKGVYFIRVYSGGNDVVTKTFTKE